MQNHRKIHTHTKVFVFLNALPLAYQKQIPSSQLKRYRQINPMDYFGYELNQILNKEIDWIKQFGDFPTAKKISIGILKLFVFFRSVVKPCTGFKSALRKEKNYIVELVQKFKDVIPVHKSSKLLGLDESTLRNWIREVRVGCSDLLINMCRRVHPNQLLLPEIKKKETTFIR